ncbi:MAG TPA: hypothetical protein VJ725_12075 [Thermoanaerobaculia bacterium]|nr:hypothetical protein [Thermoanaerobaculia bacterium]
MIAPAAVTAPRAERAAALPWTLSAMLFGSTSIVVGLIWDISWHMTIGRDTFWTPAHMATYLGGVLAGISGGWLALKTTFAGTPEERDTAVRFWGFRAPLGAWIAIWGAFAMLTSAPFDDWWHNAYGLDVEILSPPHTVLIAGMVVIQLGAMILVLAAQNRAPAGSGRVLSLAYLYAAGVVLAVTATFLLEYDFPNDQHTAIFYKVSCVAFPLLLVAVARSSRLPWAATGASAFYMLIACAMAWILPLFPARPLLGPINNPVDHMVPNPFPLLLIIPAAGIDWLLGRQEGKRGGWGTALGLAAVFLGLFFVTQWYFSAFLLSPGGRNWFFVGGRTWAYFQTLSERRYEFSDGDPVTVQGLGTAFVLAYVSARIGLWWGAWMARVRR